MHCLAVAFLLLWLTLPCRAGDPEIRIIGVGQALEAAEAEVRVAFEYRADPSATVGLALSASSDGGATWDHVPVATLSGDTAVYGEAAWRTGVIIWGAGRDWPEQYSPQMMVRLRTTASGTVNGDFLVIDISGGPTVQTYPVIRLTQLEMPFAPAYRTTAIVLARIPAGMFVMGSPMAELDHRDDETEHQVNISGDFYAGIFEVTQKQWQQVMGNNPADYPGDTRPVEDVSRDEIRGGEWPDGSRAPGADTFVGRLRTRTGLQVDLPTESQWEYACRAGTVNAWNNGSQITQLNECPNLNPLGRYSWNGGQVGQHAEVGSYRPNMWSLYDMHGNVAEWCLDRYGAYSTLVSVDPAGAETGTLYTFRGGSWDRSARDCRSARRGMANSPGRSANLGFRIVSPVPPAPE